MFKPYMLTMLAFVVAGASYVAAPAAADEPFFYYPAYGSLRGRIRYVDGIFRDKQRIRWGGGITPQGAALLMHVADVAGDVAGDVLGSRAAQEARAAEERRAGELKAEGDQLNEQLWQLRRELLDERGDQAEARGPAAADTAAAREQAVAKFRADRSALAATRGQYRERLQAAIGSGQGALAALKADEESQAALAAKLREAHQKVTAELDALQAELRAVPAPMPMP
jgi:DNA repair exonuclease SbcCD ATPase subunit